MAQGDLSVPHITDGQLGQLHLSLLCRRHPGCSQARSVASLGLMRAVMDTGSSACGPAQVL